MDIAFDGCDWLPGNECNAYGSGQMIDVVFFIHQVIYKIRAAYISVYKLKLLMIQEPLQIRSGTSGFVIHNGYPMAVI